MTGGQFARTALGPKGEEFVTRITFVEILRLGITATILLQLPSPVLPAALQLEQTMYPD
jgi:hypothetical protein